MMRILLLLTTIGTFAALASAQCSFSLSLGPMSIEAQLGERVELFCDVLGDPFIQRDFRQYLPNGDTIDILDNSDLTMERNFQRNATTLTITNVELRHAGQYGCFVFPELEGCPQTIFSANVTLTIADPTTMGMGGDPHYSILLPSGQQLCYSVQGQPDFAFNLISNKLLHMNALFIKDSKREEITWIGELGMVVRDCPKRKANSTALRFCALGHMVFISDKIKLHASGVKKLTFSGGKLSIDEREDGGDKERPEVLVDFPDIGISFTVRFVRERHLDMVWNKVDTSMRKSHGMIGQFFRKKVKIDEPRRLLLLPGGMEPVPVMRKPVWAFMERETTDEQLCWVAMNPGYQGKKLLQGHYLDYLVDDVLSSSFKFKPKKNNDVAAIL